VYGVERAAALLQVNRYKTVLNDDDRVNGLPAAVADASGLSDAQGLPMTSQLCSSLTYIDRPMEILQRCGHESKLGHRYHGNAKFMTLFESFRFWPDLKRSDRFDSVQPLWS
jgi:hypothetical protein